MKSGGSYIKEGDKPAKLIERTQPRSPAEVKKQNEVKHGRAKNATSSTTRKN